MFMKRVYKIFTMSYEVDGKEYNKIGYVKSENEAKEIIFSMYPKKEVKIKSISEKR